MAPTWTEESTKIPAEWLQCYESWYHTQQIHQWKSMFCSRGDKWGNWSWLAHYSKQACGDNPSPDCTSLISWLHCLGYSFWLYLHWVCIGNTFIQCLMVSTVYWVIECGFCSEYSSGLPLFPEYEMWWGENSHHQTGLTWQYGYVVAVHVL